MILVCNDFAEALGAYSLFDVLLVVLMAAAGDAADLFLGFACIFVLTEIFSRLLSDTWGSDDKSEIV